MAINIPQEKKEQKEKISRIVKDMSEMQLSSPTVTETILQKVKVLIPILDLTRGNIEIKTEIRIFNQKNPPPPDISFTPNEPTEITVYRVPILDNLSMLKGKQGHFIELTGTHLVYTIYDRNLTIEQKKDKAEMAIRAFQNDLLAKRDEMTEFENGELKTYIENEVIIELQKRKRESDLKDKLNPF